MMPKKRTLIPENTTSILKDGYHFTRNDLKYLQSMTLFEKVQKTQAKILEWCLYWDWKVYVSFSGGKDSTVLLDMVQRVTREFKKTVDIVFCDTGLEYPEAREFVKSYGDIVTWIKPEIPFTRILKEHGYPVISKDVSQTIYGAKKGWPSALRKLDGLNPDGSPSPYIASKYGKYKYLLDAPFQIGDDCCAELKRKPFRRYERASGNKCISAMMAAEGVGRREAYLRHGCNAFQSARPISNPMGFWTTQDVLEYLVQFDIHYVPIYGDIVQDEDGKLSTTGVERTGCIFCMFGVHCEKTPNRFQQMKKTHPKQYNYCLHQLECKKVLDYIGVPYE